MRGPFPTGCAVETERQSIGYGDYVALSCDQIGRETVNLMRAAANRSHHLIGDDQARRDSAIARDKGRAASTGRGPRPTRSRATASADGCCSN